MTMSLLQLLWTIGAPIVLGAIVLRVCGVCFRSDRLGYAAWIWPAGSLALATTLFLYLLLGVQPAYWWTAPISCALLLIMPAMRAKGAPVAPGEPKAPIQKLGEVIFWGCLGAGCVWLLLHFAAATGQPCVVGDEGSFWAMKAKTLYLDWYEGNFAAAQRFTLTPDYPLLNPLLQAWVYAQAGEIVHFENRLPIHMCTLSLWLALGAALRRHIGPWLAAAIILPLLFDSTIYWASITAYADSMVALGLVIALDASLRHAELADRAFFALACVGAAFVIWSKNEAMLYMASVVIAAALARGLRLVPPFRPGRNGRWLVVPLLVLAIHLGWNRAFGFQNDLLVADSPNGGSLWERFFVQFSDRAPVVLEEAARLLGAIDRVHGLLLLPLLASVAVLGAGFRSLRSTRRELRRRVGGPPSDEGGVAGACRTPRDHLPEASGPMECGEAAQALDREDPARQRCRAGPGATVQESPARHSAVPARPWEGLSVLVVPTLAIAGSIVGLHLVYIGSCLRLEHTLEISHDRVLMQLVPVTLVWLAAFGRRAAALRHG